MIAADIVALTSTTRRCRNLCLTTIDVLAGELCTAVALVTNASLCLEAVDAENLTVRGTAAGSRQFATDVIATCTANGDVPFATGDATATGTSSTIVTAVASTVATTAVATDKWVKFTGLCLPTKTNEQADKRGQMVLRTCANIVACKLYVQVKMTLQNKTSDLQ
ncbi:hypothetical protein NP493_8841g00001 [Ridgeia piscesae]|uniref:Uncharacterized protein n=1 Tax=Ridgeia piscesae TaxID=27915 RepID=A0AAD9IP39_RIDPI|nr:hypothetical protein NP493_8841g00001 [Ridgeia piscesae]